MVSLFGIPLPQTNRFVLKKTIRSLKPNSKKTLYFLYSEFLLRANRNPWYKHILRRANYTAIDGKGLQWSMWTRMKDSPLVMLYAYTVKTPYIIRMPLFIVVFALQLAINILIGVITLIGKYNFVQRTQNEVILGRDFVYDLLTIAQDNQWKTLVLGGSSESDTVTQTMIKKLFPQLRLSTWNRAFNSALMTDTPASTLKDEIITSENICQIFPDLYEAKQYIKTEKPDLILTCLGGSSGKQEFFIDNLKSDESVSFTLATGLGAAVDHLGGGQQQPLPPRWMIGAGLEWLYRLIRLPQRRMRIIDSIVTLWFWTTAEQFIAHAGTRKTVVCIVYKVDPTTKKRSYLLVDRPRVLAGDTGYSFVQGGISRTEDIAAAGIRELQEETSIKAHQLTSTLIPFRGDLEPHTISVLRFLIQGARYKESQHYVVVYEYSGEPTLSINWENRGYIWVDENDVESHLSIEKRKDWQLTQQAFAKYTTL